MKLETKRLILRKPRMSDWKDIYKEIRKKHFAKMLNIPHPYKLKYGFKQIFEKEVGKKNYLFIIELKKIKKAIGMIKLSIDKENLVGKTNSWTSENYQRRAYMFKAKITINDFAFNKLKLRKLSSSIFCENKASRKLQERLGYKLEGLLRKDAICKANNKIKDDCLYGLLKEDWKKIRPKLIKDLKKKLK